MLITTLKPSIFMHAIIFTYEELRRNFGIFETIRILEKTQRKNMANEPFKGLPSPIDKREHDTRVELTPAINLYHVLQSHTSAEKAFSIARRVVLQSSLLHLRALYPDFVNKNFLQTGGKVDNDGALGNTLNMDFPFADSKVVEFTKELVKVDVVHCRIPKVLKDANAYELAEIFCEVDAIYFPIFEPDVKFQRTKTIIRNGDVCDFQFKWNV